MDPSAFLPTPRKRSPRWCSRLTVERRLVRVDGDGLAGAGRGIERPLSGVADVDPVSTGHLDLAVPGVRAEILQATLVDIERVGDRLDILEASAEVAGGVATARLRRLGRLRGLGSGVAAASRRTRRGAAGLLVVIFARLASVLPALEFRLHSGAAVQGLAAGDEEDATLLDDRRVVVFVVGVGAERILVGGLVVRVVPEIDEGIDRQCFRGDLATDALELLVQEPAVTGDDEAGGAGDGDVAVRTGDVGIGRVAELAVLPRLDLVGSELRLDIGERRAEPDPGRPAFVHVATPGLVVGGEVVVHARLVRVLRERGEAVGEDGGDADPEALEEATAAGGGSDALGEEIELVVRIHGEFSPVER